MFPTLFAKNVGYINGTANIYIGFVGGIKKISQTGDVTTFSIPGASIGGLCFDGNNIWATDVARGYIIKVYLDGTYEEIDTGGILGGIYFDGTYLWSAKSITLGLKMDLFGNFQTFGIVQTGNLGIFSVAAGGGYVYYISSVNTYSICVVNATTLGAVGYLDGSVGTYSGGTGLAWDGTKMWFNHWKSSLTQYFFGRITSAGAFSNTLSSWSTSLQASASCVAYDGTYMWYCRDAANVIRVNKTTLAQELVPLTYRAYGLAYDGINMWAFNNGSAYITRIHPDLSYDDIFIGTTSGNVLAGICTDGVPLYTWAE